MGWRLLCVDAGMYGYVIMGLMGQEMLMGLAWKKQDGWMN